MTDLVGVSEIAHLLDTSKQYASVLTQRRDFPPPVVTLAMGSVWRARDVRAWASAKGRAVKQT